MTKLGLQKGLVERLLRELPLALGKDGETASLTSDCLQEELSSSDDDGSTWEPLKPTKCPQASATRACASES
eukprot:4034246-Amphidinium_carterae.1